MSSSCRITLDVPPETIIFIGHATYKSPGNRWLREVVAEFSEEYEAADLKADCLDKGLKLSRQDIVEGIVSAIRLQGGRFVIKKDNAETNEKRAREKVTNEFKQLRLADALRGGNLLPGISVSPDVLARGEVTVLDEDVTIADVLFGKTAEAKKRALTHAGNLSIIEFIRRKTTGEETSMMGASLSSKILSMVEHRGGRVLVKNSLNEPWKMARNPLRNINILVKNTMQSCIPRGVKLLSNQQKNESADESRQLVAPTLDARVETSLCVQRRKS